MVPSDPCHVPYIVLDTSPYQDRLAGPLSHAAQPPRFVPSARGEISQSSSRTETPWPCGC